MIGGIAVLSGLAIWAATDVLGVLHRSTGARYRHAAKRADQARQRMRRAVRSGSAKQAARERAAYQRWSTLAAELLR